MQRDNLLTKVHRARLPTAQVRILLTVDHQHWGDNVVTQRGNGGNIKAHQLITGFHPIAHLQLRAEMLTVKIDGIDADMHQHFHTVISLNAHGML
ncbi:hypothetical protein D3C80_1928090 [compost metagenome]